MFKENDVNILKKYMLASVWSIQLGIHQQNFGQHDEQIRYIHKYICTYKHMCARVCVYIYKHIYTYRWVCVCVHIYMMALYSVKKNEPLSLVAMWVNLEDITSGERWDPGRSSYSLSHVKLRKANVKVEQWFSEPGKLWGKRQEKILSNKGESSRFGQPRGRLQPTSCVLWVVEEKAPSMT